MKVIIFFWLCSFSLNVKYKKKNPWLFKLTNFVILAQLQMLHACTKVQIPSLCRWCKYLVGGWVVLET